MLFFLGSLLAQNSIKIASYNVENLFDIKNNGTEYEEYIPNTFSNWNASTYKIKLQNIAKVIKEMDADIVALVEIESRDALKDLRFTLKQMGLYYEYYDIADAKDTTVKVAILSKLPFTYSKELFVTHSKEYRNILEIKYIFDKEELYLFVNHWSSKAHPESSRMVFARALMQRLQEIGLDKNIILLGDFNSDYEENVRFLRERRLNDTYGKTAINHILNTTKQKDRVSQIKYEKDALYNLWYDTDEQNRYSYIYKNKKEALDNIIVSQSLLKKGKIYYKEGSIKNFSRWYLFKKENKINRWVTSKDFKKRHKGEGYSDHLPIEAEFIFQ